MKILDDANVECKNNIVVRKNYQILNKNQSYKHHTRKIQSAYSKTSAINDDAATFGIESNILHGGRFWSLALQSNVKIV